MPEGWDSADSRVLLTSTMLMTPTTLPLRGSNSGPPLLPG